MRCAECMWKYPDGMLDRMMINGNYTDPICGLCALEVSNRVHDIKRTSFQGERAESHRQAAIKWRKSHPQDAPKVN